MADHIKDYDTVCAVANPHMLKGTCIGHVMNLQGELMYVVQMKEGYFVSTRTGLALIKKIDDRYKEEMIEVNGIGRKGKTLRLTYHETTNESQIKGTDTLSEG